MAPFDSNQPIANQDLEFNHEVSHTIGGHYMHHVKNEGDFAGAQIDQLNIQVNVQVQGIGQQVGGVSDEQEKTGEIWGDLMSKAMSKILSENSKESKDSERYQQWCKRSEGHVRTTLYHEVLNKLDKTDSITVLGNAGDGKTTLLHLVSLEYSTRGYMTIEIDLPEDIHRYRDTEKPVLFVCDSLLGRIVIDHDKTKSWVNSERYTSDKVKILFACRIELWRQHEIHLHQNPMFEDTVDVRSYKLTEEDKMKIINQHLGDKISKRTKRLIVENSDFAFPECCRFVSDSQEDIDFTDTDKLVETFSNPFKFVVKQLKAIERNNKLQYATLLFCLLNGRKLPKTGAYDLLKQTNFEEVRKRYLSDKTVEELYDKLLDKAEELEGSLLTQRGDNYVFYHDSIYEAMCRVHGARYPEDILTFCEPDVVFSLFTTKQASCSDSERVTLNPTCYPQLVEIVTRECMKGFVWWYNEPWKFVFDHLNTVDVLKQWHRFLLQSMSTFSHESDISERNPTLTDVLLLITQLPDTRRKVDDVFVSAAEHGDLETSRLLIDSGVTSGARERGLLSAVRKGHNSIVSMIVVRRGLGKRHIEKGLREAVTLDRVECVREIMMLRPHIHSDTIHKMLMIAGMCDSVNSVCELLKRDTSSIHSLLKKAVWCGSVRTVTELVKRPDISKQTIQDMIYTPESELFSASILQTRRDEICAVLVKHLNTDG